MDKRLRSRLARFDPTHRASKTHRRRRLMGALAAAVAAGTAAAVTVSWRRSRTGAIEADRY